MDEHGRLPHNACWRVNGNGTYQGLPSSRTQFSSTFEEVHREVKIREGARCHGRVW